MPKCQAFSAVEQAAFAGVLIVGLGVGVWNNDTTG